MRVLPLCLLVFSLLPARALAQGCSDAGFCTMGAMKPDQPFSKHGKIRLQSLELSFYRGTTTASPKISVATLDASFNILDEKTMFQIKLPYQTARGNFGSTGGVSDISLCLTRAIYRHDKFDVSLSLGSKIPTHDGNRSTEFKGQELVLPMYYQTSLGSFDVIAGASLISRQWLVATGIQYAATRNGNRFAWGDWAPVYDGGIDYVLEYDLATDLKRGTDVMVRVERNFRFARFNASLGLLPIFRVTPDEITNRNTQERIAVPGTTGMALSGIVTLGYNFDVRSGVRLLLGRKLTQREINPDGLTRVNVSTLTYIYRF